MCTIISMTFVDVVVKLSNIIGETLFWILKNVGCEKIKGYN